jgi:hypothetical protein
MRYREADRTRSREDDRARTDDPRLKDRDLHQYYKELKEYDQLRLEHAKYQEAYAAEMARHAEHYDRAAYDRYALEGKF